jgi:hypothetical protein
MLSKKMALISSQRLRPLFGTHPRSDFLCPFSRSVLVLSHSDEKMADMGKVLGSVNRHKAA